MVEICEKSDMPEYGLYELIPKIQFDALPDWDSQSEERIAYASLALYLAGRISLQLN